MVLFAIVAALLLEQVRPLGPASPVQQGWRRWVRAAGLAVDAGAWRHGWLAWWLAVALPALAAGAVHWLLMWLGLWPLALLWGVAVLYATLGFRQFSRHFTGIRDALETAGDAKARELLAQWQGGAAGALPRAELVRRVIEHSVLIAHRHVFGVLAWFCLLAMLGMGPAGAVFYRLADVAARYWRSRSASPGATVSPALGQVAAAAWHAMDWLPARITALGFAITGSFEDAVDAWRRHAAHFADANEGVILAATAGAIGVRLGPPAAQALPGEEPRSAHLRRAVGLVWRTMALWLLLLTLLTLARVVG